MNVLIRKTLSHYFTGLCLLVNIYDEVLRMYQYVCRCSQWRLAENCNFVRWLLKTFKTLFLNPFLTLLNFCADDVNQFWTSSSHTVIQAGRHALLTGPSDPAPLLHASKNATDVAPLHSHWQIPAEMLLWACVQHRCDSILPPHPRGPKFKYTGALPRDLI